MVILFNPGAVKSSKPQQCRAWDRHPWVTVRKRL